MNPLRYLSFDDLFLLRALLSGKTLTAAARELGLSQPAVTQRLKKLEGVYKFSVIEKAGRNIRLTNEGTDLCNKAAAALQLMEGVASQNAEIVLSVGTRPEAGKSWLWPALVDLRQRHPHLTYHMCFGSGEEILALLGIGKLDVVLTSAPLTLKGYESIEVAEETYVFAAAPKVVEQIKSYDDLKNFILIEHDRSFPFTRYVDAKDKVKLRYKDVWFLGSSVSMTSALVEGLGIGIVPEYLATPYFKTKRLAKINLKMKVASDHFRLIYRTDRDIQQAVQLLASTLKKSGLK
jgi:LysR family glycine cleavage system transcriptional activator